MKAMRKLCFPIVIITFSFILCILLYLHLPDRLAVHFSLSGKANGWMAKLPAVVLFLCLQIAFLLAFIADYIIYKRDTARYAQVSSKLRHINFFRILNLIETVFFVVVVDILYFNLKNSHFVSFPCLISFLFIFVLIAVITISRFSRSRSFNNHIMREE